MFRRKLSNANRCGPFLAAIQSGPGAVRGPATRLGGAKFMVVVSLFLEVRHYGETNP
jgi:hypothetical protein